VGEWGWVVAGYAVTYAVIVAYGWRLAARARRLTAGRGEGRP
jgi:hypothetical protein